MGDWITLQTDESIKSCCAALYESEWAGLLLGDSFHPGGLATTQRLGELLELRPGIRVLDVASGKGSSAIFLAENFGCEVVGVDYSQGLVETANALASDSGLAHRVKFQQGDAENFPFEDAAFDALICECAFCTFPNKSDAAAEFARVLRPGGKVALSDLTRSGELPSELDGLMAWIACLADAQPLAQYLNYLEDACCDVHHTEAHDDALAALVHQVRGKILGTELMVKFGKLDLPIEGIETAKTLVRAAEKAVQSGVLGYALMVAEKRPDSTGHRDTKISSPEHHPDVRKPASDVG